MIRVLVDMNLSPRWVEFLATAGMTAVHWSDVGQSTAKDSEILGWAHTHGYVVFTHDLDFAALLAASQASGPSVLQVRTHDILPDAIGDVVLRALRHFGPDLEQGALVSVDPIRARARILPLRR